MMADGVEGVVRGRPLIIWGGGAWYGFVLEANNKTKIEVVYFFFFFLQPYDQYFFLEMLRTNFFFQFAPRPPR